MSKFVLNICVSQFVKSHFIHSSSIVHHPIHLSSFELYRHSFSFRLGASRLGDMRLRGDAPILRTRPP